MELGTGWLPLTAVGFWICGAEEIHTVDVNRHFLPGVFSKALSWITQNEAELLAPVGRNRIARSRCPVPTRDSQSGHQPIDLLREAAYHVSCSVGHSLHADP